MNHFPFNYVDRSSLLRRTVLLALIVVCGIGQSVQASDPLYLDLHENVVVTEAMVRIDDIASVTGATSIARATIGNVDLSQLSAGHPQETIIRDRVKARLLLEGYNGRQVVITGAASVRVSYLAGSTTPPPKPVSALVVADIGTVEVERAAQTALAATFGVFPEDIDARLASPLDLSLETGGNLVTIDVLPPANARPGRMRLSVRVFSDGQLEQVTNGLFDVRVRQPVMVASALLSRGTPLSSDSVLTTKRWTTELVDSPPPVELSQWQVRRAIPVGESISASDLTPVQPVAEEIVIKARDAVRLIARKGTLTVVVPAAEALESGRIGQMIRVRNMTSRRIVVGEVISAGEVEIRLY